MSYHIKEATPATNQLLEMAQDGIISWEYLARSALCYMSESDVADMCESEGYLEEEEEE